jgi:hypothetical protein
MEDPMNHARPTPALLWLPTLVCLHTSPALAAPRPASPPATAPSTAPPTLRAETHATSDEADSRTQREAKLRRERAVELYDEGAFDAALLEFLRAYELAPSYRLLFNLAIVSIELHDDAGAMTFFERYLQEGGEAISADDRAAVTAQLQELSANVAWVDVDVNVAGAIVLVDDRQVGTTPLTAPLRINAGLRRISARAGAHLPDSRLLELAGGDHATLALVLVEPAPPPTPPEPSTNVPWLAWGATAALAGGAIWSGLNALAAQSDYEDALGQLGTTRADLDELDRAAFRYSITADILGIAALGAGGYALYLTLDTDEPSDAPSQNTSARIQLWPGGAYLRGEF